VGGATFTVSSIGTFINNKSSTVSCTEDAKSADYAQVTTVVTWPGMSSGQQTVLRSIVSPSSNSINSKNGTMTISVTNEKGEPRAGVKLKAGVFSATSSVDGCATFPDLAAGNHILGSDGESANLVNTNSSYLGEQEAGVGAGVAKVTKLTYDSPGTVPVKFKYRVGTEEKFEPSSADSVVAFHSVMKEAKVVWAAGGARLPEIPATPLFPFTSPYSIYAGSCAGNKPSEGPAMANIVAPASATTGAVEVQLPALDLTVNEGSKAIKGAKVTITDKNNCKDLQGNPVKRSYTTNSEGKQTSAAVPEERQDPALPWGAYEVCASAKIGSSFRRKKTSVPVLVQNLAAYTPLTIDLSTSGYESNLECL
jgi:hypothetical protein